MAAATLSDRVRLLAGTRPDDDAYRWVDTRLTWASYDTLGDAVAARLVGSGVEPGDRVLVLLPDGGAVHAAFLGNERAGSVTVGVGWRAGERELTHLVTRTGATAAVTAVDTPLGPGRDVAQRLGIDPGRVVVIEDLDDRPHVDDGPQRPVDPTQAIPVDGLWLLNSTSGTTGLPKCVMQTQDRWLWFHGKAAECGGLAADEVWMSVVPAPFGFGLWTSHVTPTALGVPCLVQPRFDAAAAAVAIERDRVTVLCAVSSQFVMLLEAMGDCDLSSLRVMFTGGEAISRYRAEQFEARTGCTILNFYGSNETGMLSGTTVGDPVERRLTTGGRCVPEMRVRLYDLDGNRIPGDVGTGRPAGNGPAMTTGYYDDPQANAELFTSDGWMFMGDVVTIDDDRWLSVVGRTSDFVIRGGKNISAPAVEEEVATHPAVAMVAVVPAPDERLGEKVAAFVELRSGGSLELEELKAHLAGRGVTKEWWPEYLFVVDSLPRSSGGKVAKGDLREEAARRVTR